MDVGRRGAERQTVGTQEAGICVHHGGHCYLTTREQAAIFLRRVQKLVDHGSSELVPLLHNAGVDLLFVASNVPLQVHDERDRSLDRSHRAAGAPQN
jgi:hypothetical protein